MKTQVQKNLRFPSYVIAILEPKAISLGLTFNEYVKYLVIKEAEKEMDRKNTSSSKLKRINKI